MTLTEMLANRLRISQISLRNPTRHKKKKGERCNVKNGTNEVELDGTYSKTRQRKIDKKHR